MRFRNVPGPSAVRPLGFVTRRLRHLIIVPYLILASLLALAITYLLTSSANQSLTDRFNTQLVDAAQSAGTGLVQAEAEQLQALRAIAFTQGFAEAVTARNVSALSDLAAPQATNSDLDSVLVFSKDGTLLAALPHQNGTTTPAAALELGNIVHAALNPQGATDKLSAMVDSQGGQDGVFYTAGPVRQGDQIVGVVLVGSKVSRLLRTVGRDSLSDGITFYGPTGSPEGSVLAGSQQQSVQDEGRRPSLPPGWYDEISAQPSGKTRVRTLALAGETYVEAFGAVPGAGLGGRPPGVYGVMLRTHALDANLEQTLWAMLPVFALGLALIVVVGLTLASRIDRALAQLVAASGRVALGDLDVQVPVSRIDELGVLAQRFNDMVRGLRQLLFVKDLFGRFVSPEVSAKLLAGQIELGGEEREVTILFSDLRSFTELSARHSPAEIVGLLNDYFRLVVRAAANHGGIVNKFGGDSTLIVFGAPVDVPHPAEMALATALELESALDAMNARLVEAGWRPLRQGIGIDTGTVVAGQIGSEERMEYTVIGDAVNLASRLQVLTKSIKGCTILFSASTMAALRDPQDWWWENKGFATLAGKRDRVGIYALLGSNPPAVATGTAPGVAAFVSAQGLGHVDEIEESAEPAMQAPGQRQ